MTLKVIVAQFATFLGGGTLLLLGGSNEMCRFKHSPDDLSIDCGRTEIQRQLGNAVPSLIAEVLAREIR